MLSARARRGWAGRRRLAALGALCAASALLLATSRAAAPASIATSAEFPLAAPARLAHLLADFSTHPALDRRPWSVEQESSNYTSWRYSVSYECGARCAGRAAVEAHDVPAAGPEHGQRARAHHVIVRNVYCIRLPLLPWPQFCEESESIAEVRALGAGGARLTELASARCAGLLAAVALRGRCGDERSLRRQRDEHLRRLRLALPH